MLHESEHDFFRGLLYKSLGIEFEIKKILHHSGGDINHATKVVTEDATFFVKWNSFHKADLFEKEKRGLELLQNSCNIDVPSVLGLGTYRSNDFLVLEYIEKGRHSNFFWEDFGSKLAQLHLKTSTDFGLEYDNYIGKLHQSNTRTYDWVDFFVDQRLIPQIKIGRQKGIISSELLRKFDLLFTKLPHLIPSEKPALLHGDLWNGNFMCGPDHKVWIFDPAIYFGHREMEISFTYLFGGFDVRFYKAYNETYPIDSGFNHRIEIHNLYPLLVHLNLFGTSYLHQIVEIVDKSIR